MIRRLPALICALLIASAGCALDADSDSGARSDAGTNASDATVDVGVDSDSGRDKVDRLRAIAEAGPYNVGFTEHEVTYEADTIDEPRTLRLAIWYPTLDEEGEAAEYYNLLDRDDIYADAELATEQKAPLLVFSHGNSSMAEQSFFMTEFFATHGWVVASPDHTGNTVSDNQGSIDLTSAVYRPQDISAVLDHLLDLPDDDPLADSIAEGEIVMSGHSFGGFTTLANAGTEFAVEELEQECEEADDDQEIDFCEILGDEAQNQLFRDGFYDERVEVALPQAPGGYRAFLDGLAAIDTPTLLFTGGMDQTLPNEEEGDPIWEAMEGDHLRVDVLRGGHFTFSNMCEFFGSLDNVRDDGCSSDFIEPEAAFDLINAYSMAFARYHLYDDDSVADLVEADVLPFEGVDVQRKSP